MKSLHTYFKFGFKNTYHYDIVRNRALVLTFFLMPGKDCDKENSCTKRISCKKAQDRTTSFISFYFEKNEHDKNTGKMASSLKVTSQQYHSGCQPISW